MKSVLIGIFFLLTNFLCFGQGHYVYKGSQRYKATPSWDFEVENYHAGNLNVQVAQTSQGGFVMLKAHTGFQGTGIKGTIVLYLQDGSVIKCLDRNVKDMTNGDSKALYYFTQAEMEMLATSRIDQIRFAIRSSNGMSTLDGAYIAKNHFRPYEMFEFRDGNAYEAETSFPTEEEIAALVE